MLFAGQIFRLAVWLAISIWFVVHTGRNAFRANRAERRRWCYVRKKEASNKLWCARKLTTLTISLFSKWLNNSNSRRIYRDPSMRTTQIIAIITWFPLGSDMKTVISIHVTSHGVNKSYNTQSLSPVIHSQNTFLYIYFPLNFLFSFVGLFVCSRVNSDTFHIF